MKADEIVSRAKAVSSHMVNADSPGRAIIEIVKAMGIDDSVGGSDMIQIFGASLVMMAETMNRTAERSISGVITMMALLYADKSVEELLTMAVSLLAGEDITESDGPRVRVVVMGMKR